MSDFTVTRVRAQAVLTPDSDGGAMWLSQEVRYAGRPVALDGAEATTMVARARAEGLVVVAESVPC